MMKKTLAAIIGATALSLSAGCNLKVVRDEKKYPETDIVWGFYKRYPAKIKYTPQKRVMLIETRREDEQQGYICALDKDNDNHFDEICVNLPEGHPLASVANKEKMEEAYEEILTSEFTYRMMKKQ